jgi:hypothetical protein
MTTFSNPFNVFPGAGGNWQEIMTRWWSPNISLNFAGDAGKAQKKINEIKKRRQTNAVDKARAALSALSKDDYRRLLRSLDPEQPPGAD